MEPPSIWINPEGGFIQIIFPDPVDPETMPPLSEFEFSADSVPVQIDSYSWEDPQVLTLQIGFGLDYPMLLNYEASNGFLLSQDHAKRCPSMSASLASRQI